MGILQLVNDDHEPSHSVLSCHSHVSFELNIMSTTIRYTHYNLLFFLALYLFLIAEKPAAAQTPTDSQPQLGLNEPPPYLVGQTLELFGAFRSGAADAIDAELKVTASAGVTFLSVTAIHPTQPLECVLNNPQEVVCTRNVVRGSTEITIQMRFDQGGDQTITAEVSQSNPDPDPENNMLAGTIPVEGDAPKADLGILLDISSDLAGKRALNDTLTTNVNDTLAVEARVTNNGPDEASQVIVTVTLDENGRLIVLAEDIDTCGGRGTPSILDEKTVQWDVDQVNEGESFSCGLRILTVERGEAEINGTTFSSTTDPDLSNNTSGLFTIVEENKTADLAVVKTVMDDSVFVGDRLVYTVTLSNEGPSDAANVRFIDLVFNDSLTFVPDQAPQGCVLSQGNGQLACTIASLPAGQSVSLSYQAITKLTGTVTNFVTNLSSNLPDPDQSDNSASVVATVRGGADVSVEKTAAFVDPNTTGPGAVIAYTVTVTNNGPETAFLVETDDLVFSDSLEFVAESVPQNCDLGTATDDDTGKPLSTMQCRLAAILEVGESQSVTYAAVSKQIGTVSNEVEVESALRDLNLSNNIAVATTVVGVRTAVDFSLDASASASSATAGDRVRFDFSCTADQPAESCQITATADDSWTNPVLNGIFVVADSDTTAVTEGDSMNVEVDPEGLPAGTTRITYTFRGGYTVDGETYIGSFTLGASKSNPSASVRFEASGINNNDPNIDNDVIEILVNIDALATTSEDEPVTALPKAPRLHGNYPNPFITTTLIRYDIAEHTHVRLDVFNMLGQTVETLVNTTMQAGSYRATWKVQDLPAGIYFYRLQAGAFSQTRKMLLVR